jgi:hypothetical protein
MESSVMPILLWVVMPFAIWSACMGNAWMGQASIAPSTAAKPREFGGG